MVTPDKGIDDDIARALEAAVSSLPGGPQQRKHEPIRQKISRNGLKKLSQSSNTGHARLRRRGMSSHLAPRGLWRFWKQLSWSWPNSVS
jgi:hypothetical protein